MSRQPLKKIPADPRVALAAWEVPSETRLDLVHHVALMVNEADPGCSWGSTGEHFETEERASQVVCRRCRSIVRFWSCDCEDFTLGNGKRALEGKPEVLCKHILACREQRASERTNGRTS